MSRTFVSSTGVDSNPCSRLSPCRSFTAALAVTDVDGEIIVIDSAGYGPVSIGQSVSITTPPGVYAGITANGTDAITVTIVSTDRVVLKGLTIIGVNGAATGVNFGSAGELRLEDLSVSGFSGNQIATLGGGSLYMHHCVVRGSRPAATSGGVFVAASSAQRALIENSRIEDMNVGVFVGTNSIVTVVDSYVGTCTSFALKAQAGGVLNIERSVAVDSTTGVDTVCLGGNPTVRLSNNTIVANVAGVNACATSVIFSRQNNTIAGNSTDLAGSGLAPLGAN